MRTSGPTFKRLMRRHGVTIRELARRMNVPMKSVRRARECGAPMPNCLDFEEFIRREFTPKMRAMLRQWRAAKEPQ